MLRPVLVLSVVLPLVLSAQGVMEFPGSPFTGQTFMDMTPTQRSVYAAGFLDGVLQGFPLLGMEKASSDLTARLDTTDGLTRELQRRADIGAADAMALHERTRWLRRCLANLSVKDVTGIIESRVLAYPDTRREGLHYVSAQALLNACHSFQR